MSRKRPRSTSARWRWLCERSTCSTMGSCSGGSELLLPCPSHTSKAVSCSEKKTLGVKCGEGDAPAAYTCAPAPTCAAAPAPSAAEGPPCARASCTRHISAARSHACHIGWLCVGGSTGYDTGVQPSERRMRSASKKFRKSEATSRSCRKSFWKSGLGSVFHAMVSVIAVKIQLSSPSGVFRSFWRPGMASTISGVTLPARRLRRRNHRSAILMGVVRHEVKTSAGSEAS
mmetsp:Transcript_14174/g.44321  ORF Transcript_14174/g.44321 Transcript_14174/m.44321 type:complete len:230 (-) Transcript_14174:764-1453(-)